MNNFKIIILTLLLCDGILAVSQDIPLRPEPPRLVNDLAGILTPEQVQQLERKLVNFNDSTSTQIAVVTVSSLNGYDKADFAFRIGEQWGVGQKGKNNGIVVLVKPKYGEERGEAYIAVGYGLEGVIPDAIGKRIVEYEMIPNFKENNYFGGLDAGTTTLMELASGEFTADQYVKKTQSKPYAIFIPILVLLFIFFLIRSSRARSHSVGKSIPFWTAFWLLGSMGGHSGNWKNFSSGGGSFGGGSFGGGGGFGGFGGGSFGGGGAGGSW
ncbi:MAG: TPM domain-containing protein [Bacteroidales bacterium]|nr:TPM domain-containing protein [Bacteroidales bacterium]